MIIKNLVDLQRISQKHKNKGDIVESIVGYKQVTENAGKVLNVPIVEGYSTTNIVEKIKLTI